MLRDVDDDVDNNKDEEKGERGRGHGTAQKGKRSIYLLAHKSKCCWMQMRRRNGASQRERDTHYSRYLPPLLSSEVPSWIMAATLSTPQWVPFRLSSIYSQLWCSLSILVLSSCHIKQLTPQFSNSLHNAHAKSRLNQRVYTDTIYIFSCC